MYIRVLELNYLQILYKLFILSNVQGCLRGIVVAFQVHCYLIESQI